MRAPVSDFIAFLVSDMEDTESESFAQELLAKAKAKITGGNGEVLFFESGTANGKSFTIGKELSATEMAYACRAAIDQYRNTPGAGMLTFLDFSRIAG